MRSYNSKLLDNAIESYAASNDVLRYARIPMSKLIS